MDEQNKNVCNVCEHGMGMGKCCGKYHHQYHLLRWFLAIVLVCMIFSLGMKVGQFKAMFESQFEGSYGHMRYGQNMMYYRGGFEGVPTGQVIISQPASPTIKK